MVHVNRPVADGNQGGGAGGNDTAIAGNNSLYFLVNVSANVGSDGMTGGTWNIVNITIEGWWDDEFDSPESPFDYNTTAGRNTNFRINFTTANNYSGPVNTSTLTWPAGPGLGDPEFRVDHLPIGATNTVRRQNATQIEVGIPIYMDANVRWARNATFGVNNSQGANGTRAGPGLNDLDSWNFRCLVGMDSDPSPGIQSVVYNQEFTDPYDVWEFSTFKYSSISITGNPSGSFAPGQPETGFPCNSVPCQDIDYKSNAPFNLSANISNLDPDPDDLVYCPADGAACIEAAHLGIDTGQMAGTGGAQGSACAPNSCYRFDWDDPATPAAFGDGFLWVRGANGTGPLKADAAFRWNNITCGSEEFDDDSSSTAACGGLDEDVGVRWFAALPLGILEGTYAAHITYKLRTHANPSPRTQGET
jgi:hypothetical protein